MFPKCNLALLCAFLVITRGNQVLVMVLKELSWLTKAAERMRVLALCRAKVS